ncbi:MAG: hypothetical protein R3282_08545 [Rhodothermales bacterium]|nr:hypothetical protein [Rhodothermales bacterium]
MSGVCDRIFSPAPTGTYQLEVASSDGGSNVTISGRHGVDGLEVESWTQSDLLNQTIDLEVRDSERHQIVVLATFVTDATVVVTVRRNGAEVVPPCTLTRDGNDQAAVALLAALPQGGDNQ